MSCESIVNSIIYDYPIRMDHYEYDETFYKVMMYTNGRIGNNWTRYSNGYDDMYWLNNFAWRISFSMIESRNRDLEIKEIISKGKLIKTYEL